MTASVMRTKTPAQKALSPVNQTYDLNQLFEARRPLREAFVNQQGWGDAEIAPLGEDCAFRRYYKLTRANGETALVIDSIREMEETVAPSHKLSDFVLLADRLAEEGIRVPQVFAHDLEAGYALIEDLGVKSFNAALKAGEDEVTLYRNAVITLKAMHESEKLNALELKSYYDTHVHGNRVDITHWYYTAATGQKADQAMISDFYKAWEEIESTLPACPQGFTHCDYHVDNLMLVSDGKGEEEIAVLDFQGAVKGPAPYDLANILEDARRSLPETLKQELKDLYTQGLSDEDKKTFFAWYDVLAAQFHCRVIGLFVRLYVRDNKPIHLHHIKRLQNYLKTAIKRPHMKPLADWFDRYSIDLNKELSSPQNYDLTELRRVLDLQS